MIDALRDVAVFAAGVGAVLNSYFVFRLNAKFDAQLAAVREELAAVRAVMDRTAAALDAHVNAPGLHGR